METVEDERLPWSGRRQQKKRDGWRRKRQRYAETTRGDCNVFTLDQDGCSQICKIATQGRKNKENQSLVVLASATKRRCANLITYTVV